MDETEKKIIVDEIFRRVEKRFIDEYGDDLRYVHRQRLRDLENNNSRRRVFETITGTAGAVGFLAVLGWLGSVIIETIRNMLNGGM